MTNKTVQRAYCTTREAAEMLGISLRTAQLWVESGILSAWKTDGGHRRISRESIKRLLEETPQREGSFGNQRHNRFTILVVEDEPDLLRVYEMNMLQWPMKPRVITARDGYQALVLLGSERPDMMVTDLKMPNVDGFHMLNAISTMPEASGTAIVVVSGLDKTAIASQGGIPDSIPVLPKPIPFSELIRIANDLSMKKRSLASA